MLQQPAFITGVAGFIASKVAEMLLQWVFRCNCATYFGDDVPQKKNDFLTKIINLFEIFSFCFSLMIHRSIQSGVRSKQACPILHLQLCLPRLFRASFLLVFVLQ